MVVCAVAPALLTPLSPKWDCSSVVTLRRGAVTLRPLRKPCALRRACFTVKEPSRGRERPVEDSALTSLQGKLPWRGGSGVEAPQALAASSGLREAILPRGHPRLAGLVLSEIHSPSVEGYRGLAQYTLVLTGLTVAPGLMAGTTRSRGRRRSGMGPKCPAGPRHVASGWCASASPEEVGVVVGPTTPRKPL